MNRRKKKNRLNKASVSRLLSATNRAWVLDPILNENEEWTECVRTKRSHDEEESLKDSEPDDSSDDFDE